MKRAQLAITTFRVRSSGTHVILELGRDHFALSVNEAITIANELVDVAEVTRGVQP